MLLFLRLSAFQPKLAKARWPNIFPREGRVRFDEKTHTYTVDGVVAPRSVTSLLHAYAEPFDAARAAASMRSGFAWEDRRAELEALGLDATLLSSMKALPNGSVDVRHEPTTPESVRERRR